MEILQHYTSYNYVATYIGITLVLVILVMSALKL